MSMVFSYQSIHGSWSVDLGTQAVRLGTVTLTMGAQMGQITTPQVMIDDPSGNVGHSNDQLLYNQVFKVTESACTVGNQILFYGYTDDRSYEATVDTPTDSLRTGTAVRIGLSLADLNKAATFHVIGSSDSPKRPQETIDARIAWLLSIDPAFADNGLVASSSTTVDATDYTNQYSGNVLDDCAQAVGFNWFIYEDETNGHSLAFFNPNTSSLYSSTLRLTTVLADVDSTVKGGDGPTHTWQADRAILTRSGKTLASQIVLPYANSTYTGSRTATETTYGDIQVVAADSNVKTAAQAANRVRRMLWENATEEDTIAVTVRLPAAHVNDCREGQRIEAKFRELPNYKSAYAWFRILDRTVKQDQLTDEFYTVDMTLSPQETAQPVVGIVQQVACDGNSAGGADLTFPNPVTIGNILVAVIHQAENWTGDVIPPNTDPSDDRWGAGAWTELAGPGRDKNYAPNTAFDRGSAIFAKIADATTQTGHVYKYQDATVYEISGFTLTGATALTADLQSTSTNLDVGSLSTPSAGALCFLGVSQNTGTIGSMTFSPETGWVTDHQWTNIYFSAPFPCWQGHFTADGTSAVEAKVTSSVNYPWGGVAVAIEPV